MFPAKRCRLQKIHKKPLTEPLALIRKVKPIIHKPTAHRHIFIRTYSDSRYYHCAAKDVEICPARLRLEKPGQQLHYYEIQL